MKTTNIRRFEYLLKTKSEAAISRISGIPRSTLYDFKKGIRPLPTKWTNTLRNTFQRESYSNMREAGFSASQAKRFSWYTPESIGLKEGQLTLAVKSLTAGAVAQKELRLIDAGIEWDEDELWAEMEDAIKDGLSESKKSYEEWMDYM